MASKAASTDPGTGDQPQIDDEPPAYDHATGTLEVRQDGISTESKVGGASHIAP